MFACLLQWFFIWKPSFVCIFQDVVRKLSGFLDTTGFGVYWLAAVTFSVLEFRFASRGVDQDIPCICSISYHKDFKSRTKCNNYVLCLRLKQAYKDINMSAKDADFFPNWFCVWAVQIISLPHGAGLLPHTK